MNKEFGENRTVIIDNEPWFIGKDVAMALGYSDTFGALKKHVSDEDKQNCQNDSFGTPRGMTIINESGLYAIIFGSKLESAKRFKHCMMGKNSAAACEDRSAEGGEPPECFEIPQSGA